MAKYHCLGCGGSFCAAITDGAEAENKIGREFDPTLPQVTHGCTCGALHRMTPEGTLRLLTEAEKFDLWATQEAAMEAGDAARELMKGTGSSFAVGFRDGTSIMPVPARDKPSA